MKNIYRQILNKIIFPTLEALKEIGTEYKGFLYAGLMIIKNEPYLIEFNVRMGDPECQTILPRLKTDFFEIIYFSLSHQMGSLMVMQGHLLSYVRGILLVKS